MDEQLRKRVVGLVTLGIIAVLLSWLLPRPGLDSLSDASEQVVSIDLVEPEPASQEDLIAMSSPAARAANDDPDPAQADPVAGSAEPQPSESPKEATPPKESPKSDEPSRAGQTKPSPTVRPAETQAKAEPKPETKPEPKAAPKPEPTAPEPEVAKSEPVTKPLAKAAPGTGGFYVQAGAFSQLDSARAMQARCNLQGLECKLLPTDSSQGTLYRVRCGPYGGRDVAEAAQSRLGSAGIKSSLVASGG